MNETFEYLKQNGYDGNGWSKYQVMVLQQLGDHNILLQNLNREITELKQTFAVSDMELKMWRANVMADIANTKEDIDFMLYDEKGVCQKVSIIDRELDVVEQANVKLKATWALYGSIAMFVANIIIQLYRVYYKI